MNLVLANISCLFHDGSAANRYSSVWSTKGLSGPARGPGLGELADRLQAVLRAHRHREGHKTDRRAGPRLSRGGDRVANKALHTVAVVRLKYDERTRAYARRRTAEGLSMKDIMRCLKRAIAREIYQELTRPTGFAITPENPALNAFAITFNGRITPTGN